ncbi:MAG: serine protease [Acidobacteria bacterium]|nr:serine protease [Acidobacteriota bacterium]
MRNYREGVEPKVVNGKPAPAGTFPWQVAIGASEVPDAFYAHFCGGSIHSATWIITAAHCVEGLLPSEITITAGTNRLDDTATQRRVRRIIIHKDYGDLPHNNDIALIELVDALPLSTDGPIRAVPLLTLADEGRLLTEGAPMVVTGWGRTTERGVKVRDLRYLDNLPIVPRNICNRTTAYDGEITNNMICAGVLAGGMDSCKGDSGGPLTAETERAPKLAGVVSWGEGCARANRPGVYTRVSNYVGWVSACISNSPRCNR